MEIPAPSPELDYEAIREEIHALRHELQQTHESLDELKQSFAELVASHNAVGENLQWLVANTQGIFQMFNNPQMMSQIMGQFMGGVSKVG